MYFHSEGPFLFSCRSKSGGRVKNVVSIVSLWTPTLSLCCLFVTAYNVKWELKCTTVAILTMINTVIKDNSQKIKSALCIYCDENLRVECFSMVASLGGCCVLAVSSFFMQFADTEQLTTFDHLVQFLKGQNTFPNRPGSAIGLTFTLQPWLPWTRQLDVPEYRTNRWKSDRKVN